MVITSGFITTFRKFRGRLTVVETVKRICLIESTALKGWHNYYCTVLLRNDDSQGECSLDPLKKLVVEIIAFLSTLGSLETDSG